MHESNPRDLLEWEFRQRSESGYEVGALAELTDKLLADPDSPDDAFLAAYHDLLGTTQRSDWPYEEPDTLDGIRATLTAPAALGDLPTDLEGRVLGGWLGRCAGCNLGKPIENGEYWTPTRIRSYLELAGAWPLVDYLPALDPMPDGFRLNDCWTSTTLGNIHGSARDDDVDYTLLGLHLVETYGDRLTPADVAAEWLNRLPFTQTYTAERATYRNLVNGVPVELAGAVENPYREWIGAQIRGDAFGFVNPGNPRAAAELAFQDAALSHRANGIYGEMWAAATVAAAFTAASARDAVISGLAQIPPRSRLAEALTDILAVHGSGASWDDARRHIEDRYGHYSWVHTINNAAVVAAGLLWGDGDYTRSIALTVVGGWDTDSNGATAGSVAGVLAGVRGIGSNWTAPLANVIGSSLSGFDKISISEVAARTLAAARPRPARTQ